MSNSFRDKGRLSDRFRNKSGDEILQSLRDQLDQDKRMFFDSTPAWGESAKSTKSPFSRAGFPFDTEEDSRLPRSSRLQKHLDDIASRHPEFADHLRPEMSGFRTWGPRHRHGSGGSSGIFSSEEDASDNRSQASGGSEASGGGGTTEPAASPSAPETDDLSRGRNKIPQYGLRNTVDLGGAAQKLEQSERNQRSWSAPPDARNNEPNQPKRFVSRIEIQPSVPGVQQVTHPPQQSSPPPANSSSPGKPPVAPKQSVPRPASNVRHIPIFVEGRDEPVLPKDSTDNVMPSEHFSEFSERPNFSDHFSRPQFGSPFGQQHFGTPPKHQPFHPPPTQHTFQSQPHTQQHTFHPQQTTHGFHPQQAQQPAPPQKRPTASQAPPTKRPTDPPASSSPPPPPAAPPVNDPLAKVAAVQKDVDALTEQVSQFTGTSRKDKHFIYLDEMLTRNLLRLDDIETQGKETIRQARKDTIRSIQHAISMLESKATDAPKTDETMEVSGEENQNCPIEQKEDGCLDGGCPGKEETDDKSGDISAKVDTQSSNNMEEQNSVNMAAATDQVSPSENIDGGTTVSGKSSEVLQTSQNN